ncbi:DUF6338 family protein [Pseudomonas migulae]
MDEATNQIFPILQTLLPGFVTTIIFYWLSDAPKPGQFERVIQALICSAMIQVFVVALKEFCFWVGNWFFFEDWYNWLDTGWAVIFAVSLGVSLAYWAKHDTLYRAARFMRLTNRTSVPVPEWDLFVRSFRDDPKLRIVLNLLDGRRLEGYPRVWPANPSGHYLMEVPHWTGGEKNTPNVGIDFILISNIDVLWVEILEQPEVTK